jgi:8-oxo-dGTP diphosphatase
LNAKIYLSRNNLLSILKKRAGDQDLQDKKYFVNVEGVYVKNRKILLLLRGAIPFKGYWHLVGGQVEENETLKEALKREFKEETNLDAEIGDILDGRIEETFDRIKIIVTFEVVSARGKITLNSENEEYGWFSKTPCNTFQDFTKYLEKQT